MVVLVVVEEKPVASGGAPALLPAPNRRRTPIPDRSIDRSIEECVCSSWVRVDIEARV